MSSDKNVMRTGINTKEDKVFIFEQLKHGKPLTLIARELNELRPYLVTVGSLSKLYYHAIRKEADERQPAAEVTRVLNEIDWLISEAMSSWYKSLSPVEQVMTSEMSGYNSKEGETSQNIKRLQSTTTSGDSRFLNVVLKGLERRAKLLGLDQPQRVEIKLRQVLERAGIDDEMGMTSYMQPFTSEAEVIDYDEVEDERTNSI